MPGRRVIFLLGPTAIGKTELSIKLAKRLNGEIISSDSMQVYKGMSILSQAPTLSQRRKVTHHLISTLSPTREYSAFDFRREATRLIRDIIKKGKTPIVVGGSGLYIKALIDGLFPSPKRDLTFRKEMEGYRARHGARKLYLKLQRQDPETAGKIHPNDTRRIIRALEIYHTTGSKMSELKNKTRGLKEEFDIKIFGLTRAREEIYRDIDLRVEKMFNNGLVSEVKRLSKLRLSRTARAALGIKELRSYIKGDSTLESAKELLKKNTRHLAKKQITWFRADGRIKWFDISRLSDGEIIEEICKEVTSFYSHPLPCPLSPLKRGKEGKG